MLDLEYVFVGIDMSNGYYFKKTASVKDINRAKNTNNKTTLTFKNRKKQLRYIRKEHHDAEREKEFGKITFFICFFSKFVFLPVWLPPFLNFKIF